MKQCRADMKVALKFGYQACLINFLMFGFVFLE